MNWYDWRNKQIHQAWRAGATPAQLAEKWYMAPTSIERIIKRFGTEENGQKQNWVRR